MRLVDPARIDLDAFRLFVEAQGATVSPTTAHGQILAFIDGNARGTVAMRKRGQLSFSGFAEVMLAQFEQAARPTYQAAPAKIIQATMHVSDHERAREILAEARTATVYTDGSCVRAGIGPGGWAAVVKAGFATVEIYGGARHTTVNRMEITAAIVALEILPVACAVKVNTDSQYLRRSISGWIEQWKTGGWQTSTGEPVKNRDLFERLDLAQSKRIVRWKWVPAHRGIALNERADFLAKQGRWELVNKEKENTNEQL